MKNLIVKDHGKSFVTFKNIVDFSGNTDSHVRRLIREDMETLKELGLSLDKDVRSAHTLNFSKMKFNQDSAMYLLALMQNTPEIKLFKKNLILQFSKMRETITNELCKTFEHKELKAEATINKQIEIIQELKLNRMRTFSGGKISLAKFIKENKITMSDDDAWNILTDERIVHVKTVCYDRHMLDVIIDPRLATQNTTNGIQFNPRFLEEIFKDFLEEKEAGLFDFEEED